MPDNEAELRSYFRGFFDKESTEADVRAAMGSESGHDPALWQRAAGELGLAGLGIAEAYGGGGGGLPELGIAFEEMGRSLACAPFLSTIALATTALSEAAARPGAGHPDVVAIATRLEAIAAGEATATLAWSGARPSASDLRISDGRLSGTAAIVIDGCTAELILVAARTAEGTVGLFAVEAGMTADHSGEVAAGVTRIPLPAMDTTRRLARLAFSDTPVVALSSDAGAALEATMDVAVLLLAAEQLGGAQHLLEATVDYAKSRVQFGRAIGSFQTIKHRCADMLMDVELARSLVYHALHQGQTHPESLPVEAALTRSFVSDAYVRAAGASLQIHGGIGFTWEHPTHLYLKRAKSSQLIFGSPTQYRRRLAELLGLSAGHARAGNATATGGRL